MVSVFVVLLCHDLTTTESRMKVWCRQNAFEKVEGAYCFGCVCASVYFHLKNNLSRVSKFHNRVPHPKIADPI